MKTAFPRIGEMRDLMTIEKPNPAKTAAGTPDGWVTFAQVWGKYDPLSTRLREGVVGKVLESAVNVMVQTRYVAGVTPAMRIRFEGRNLNIKTVIDLGGRRRYLEMWCLEVE